MKHIQSVNEWFGSDLINQKKANSKISEFVKNLINIIKTENLYIGFNGTYSERDYYYDGHFDIIFENKNYRFETSKYSNDICIYDIENKTYELENKIEVNFSHIKPIIKLYEKQENEEKLKRNKEALEKLPDLSDVSRAAKKYNL